MYTQEQSGREGLLQSKDVRIVINSGEGDAGAPSSSSSLAPRIYIVLNPVSGGIPPCSGTRWQFKSSLEESCSLFEDIDGTQIVVPVGEFSNVGLEDTCIPSLLQDFLLQANILYLLTSTIDMALVRRLCPRLSHIYVCASYTSKQGMFPGCVFLTIPKPRLSEQNDLEEEDVESSYGSFASDHTYHGTDMADAASDDRSRSPSRTRESLRIAAALPGQRSIREWLK
jgi:hypothetical protein